MLESGKAISAFPIFHQFSDFSTRSFRSRSSLAIRNLKWTHLELPKAHKIRKGFPVWVSNVCKPRSHVLPYSACDQNDGDCDYDASKRLQSKKGIWIIFQLTPKHFHICNKPPTTLPFEPITSAAAASVLFMPRKQVNFCRLVTSKCQNCAQHLSIPHAKLRRRLRSRPSRPSRLSRPSPRPSRPSRPSRPPSRPSRPPSRRSRFGRSSVLVSRSSWWCRRGWNQWSTCVLLDNCRIQKLTRRIYKPNDLLSTTISRQESGKEIKLIEGFS